MGFWSSVGSAFRSVGSAIVSGARAVGSAISSGISAVTSAGSRLFKSAASAIKQMASKVSDWKSLIVETVKGGIKGAKLGASKGPWGMLFGGLIGAGIGGYNEYKRQANIHDDKNIFTEEEFENFQEQKQETQTDTDFERLGNMMSEFLPALQRKFSSKAPVESFEEYLRIDVSMAFIRNLLNKLEKMENPSELTSSDRRFIELIDKLALDKPMTEKELHEFDGLVKQRFGKSLLLIGSERLFALWTNEEETCKQNVNQQRTSISRAEIRFKELESRKRYNLPMTEEDKIEFDQMQQEMIAIRTEYDQARDYLKRIRLMTGVAEGLLQQAEADNQGKILREQEKIRADRAGAILVNMERELDTNGEVRNLPLSVEDEKFLNQYVDLNMPAAIRRKDKHASEYKQGSVEEHIEVTI